MTSGSIDKNGEYGDKVSPSARARCKSDPYSVHRKQSKFAPLKLPHKTPWFKNKMETENMIELQRKNKFNHLNY